MLSRWAIGAMAVSGALFAAGCQTLYVAPEAKSVPEGARAQLVIRSLEPRWTSTIGALEGKSFGGAKVQLGRHGPFNVPVTYEEFWLMPGHYDAVIGCSNYPFSATRGIRLDLEAGYTYECGCIGELRSPRLQVIKTKR